MISFYGFPALLRCQASVAEATTEQLAAWLSHTVKAQNGVLTFLPCFVWRPGYSGRGMLAEGNWLKERQDDRGYNKVERWICSITDAANERGKRNEGQSKVLLRAPKAGSADEVKVVLFKSLVPAGEKQLFGEFRALWPLTKILDIGGAPVQPRLDSPSCYKAGEEKSTSSGDHVANVGEYESEVPPIPAHVHMGDIVDGKATGHGKKEVNTVYASS